jgi:hypothetical protein
LFNTEKEKNLFLAHSDPFVKIGAEFLLKTITVDMFILAQENRDLDLTNIIPLSTMTGGQIYYYPNYINHA